MGLVWVWEEVVREGGRGGVEGGGEEFGWILFRGVRVAGTGGELFYSGVLRHFEGDAI